MISTIALREFRALFLTPLAWVILAISQMILSWVFFSQIDNFFIVQDKLTTMKNAPGVTDLVITPVLEIASIMLLMITPLLTMRLLSEEKRNGTLNLLLSSPISVADIVLGKFLGIILFMLLFVGLISLMPLSLLLGADLDLGKLAAGLLGLTLMLCSFSAAGLYLSSLTSNPTIAAISTFGLLLLLWIIDRGADSDSVLSYISMTSHFLPMMRGIIDSVDITYFALFISTFLLLSIRQMDAQRLQQ